MELGFATVLRAGWIAGILPLLVAAIPSPLLRSYHRILTGFAGRGKITKSNKLSVPQRYFLHFYVTGTAWTTLLLFATWSYAYKMVPLDSESLHFSTIASHLTGGSHVFSMHKTRATSVEYRYRVWGAVFLLLLMEVQILRRLYETIYVFNYSPAARMHLFAYFTGLYFYVAAPLSLCSTCAPEVFKFAKYLVAEFIVQGRDKMQLAEFNWWGYVKPLTLLVWYQWLGAATFIWGWIHQQRCHAILGSLREKKEQANEYVIPYGDWFKIVSCPHYLAEMVIYAGLLIASGGSDLTIWLLFGFVVVNLTFAAAETQRWYLRKFETYPPNRRAIFPYFY
ncbi:hypothetical protein Syun_005302 [Stephania yunnanensis]|uniref:3-oxo-5-alpha-steroid 4-dehydrogenase C-terminal domain-containing protein n=1 Tax=Stephania yunnanensis TaxID=152371 RepID=A0AAP0L747_9MAGN